MELDPRLDMLTRFVDFLWSVSNFFVKGFAFYITINVAAIGYILSDKASPSLKFVASIFGGLSSLLFLACLLGYLSWAGGMSKTLERVNKEFADNYSSFDLAGHFRRGRVFLKITGFSSLALVAMVMVIYLYLIKTYLP